MLQIANTRDSALSALKIIVYGPSGIGKTCFGATFPRPLFLDCEGGLLSLRASDVDYVRCRTVQDVAEAIRLVRDKQAQYDTLVVDSISELVRMVIDEVRPAAGAAQAPMSLRDWGRSIEVMRRLVRVFRDLPMHVVFTAVPREIRSSAGEIVVVRPALPGRLAEEVCAAVDFVFFLTTKPGGSSGTEAPARALLTTHAGRAYAKDRSGRLPTWIEPSWAALSAGLALPTPAAAA